MIHFDNSRLFSSKTVLLVVFAINLQVIFSLDDTYVDDIIDYCKSKVRRRAARDENYIKEGRAIGEPVLTVPLITELPPIIYGITQRQLVFECITNRVNKSSHENLYTNNKYRGLVQKCISKSPTTPQCDPSYPYRMINGTCNNLLHRTKGSTLSCFRRLFPANFKGASRTRKSVHGKRRLPQPRFISLNIIKPWSRPTVKYNSLFVFFGQAVAHDLAELPFTPIDVDQQLDCCKYARTKEQHPECVPILIQPNDPFYSTQNVSCLNAVRMASCHTCSIGKRDLLNQVTSYIDCSLTYGQIDERAKQLRKNDGSGKLLNRYTEAGEFMPPETQLISPDRCGDAEKQQYCFKTGDTRTNQHTILIMLQTILLREHNRIADKLKYLNPHWLEEKLYQESRKILIAEFQVIVYKEYLPILIGPQLMSKYGLNIGYGSYYDNAIDPSTSIEFNAAAFRVHSLIPGKVVPDEEFEYLKTLYVNAVPLYERRTSPFLSKMSKFSAEKYDWYMPTDITDFLYLTKNGTYGFDLAAVDVLRGRDVGIPTYSQVIEYMENRPGTIRTFDDLKNYTVPECLRLLQKTYQDVRDIDLWVALNCERVPDGLIISPRAAEIIAEQFQRVKFGDRFYIEHDYTLTDAQRQTLLSASLAKLICDNTEVERMQPMAMLFPSIGNMPLFCSNIDGVDLDNWKEVC